MVEHETEQLWESKPRRSLSKGCLVNMRKTWNRLKGNHRKDPPFLMGTVNPLEMAIFNGTFNGVDTQFRCHSDLPRHGCIDISTPPPRHFGVWMDAWTDLRLKVCSQEIASWRAPCGLSHDWEIQKKKVMMEYDGYCLKDLEVEHVPHSFRSCDISHYEDQASSLPPTAKTHGPMDPQNWSCMGKVALYQAIHTCGHGDFITMPWKLPVSGCMILIH